MSNLKKKHLRSLEVLHQDVLQGVFISIITSKAPKDVLLQLGLQKGARNKWTVGKLRDILNDYVSAREKAEQHGYTEISSKITGITSITNVNISFDGWTKSEVSFI